MSNIYNKKDLRIVLLHIPQEEPSRYLGAKEVRKSETGVRGWKQK